VKKKLEDGYSIMESKNAFGWLDLNLIKHCHTINYLSSLYLTGLDVLDDLDKIKICTQYKLKGEIVEGMPSLIDEFGECEP